MISVPMEAVSESETMIYGKGLSTLESEDESNGGAESHGSTSWPPKSGLDRDLTSTVLKDHTPTMWPPPQAPQGLVSKHYPTVNIVLEEAPSERESPYLETIIKEGTVVVEDKGHLTEEVLREDITTGVLKRPNSMEEAMSQIVRSQGSRDRDKLSGPDDAGDVRLKDREVNMTSSKFDPTYLKQERKNMTFSIPLWNDNSNELVYTELACVGTLNIDLQELSATAPSSEVGQWGEQFVLEYLRQQMRSNQNIHSVEWANSDGEKGLPYDFIVKYRTNEPDKLRTVYVEVKATVCWDKDIFPISSNQIELAFNQKDQFQILRVYGAGSLNSKLVLLENVADLMWKQQIHLFMVI
ncbi:unnamed protein product [Lymnaea stagnalis]|uniref:Protein NO VEIN C-terminal domain-containing protein n=1 Tax=Lymnaea stagnalis TaxID=6523 RepID=A0AAV2IGP4_LYMST